MRASNQEAVLRRTEWDFDLVSDSEIIACCMWEYARESKTISMAADHYWCIAQKIENRELFKKDPEKEAEFEKEAGRLCARAKSNGFDYDRFCEQWYASDLAWVGIYEKIVHKVRDAVAPWREQPKAFRDFICKHQADSIILRPLEPSYVGELEELWKGNKEELEEARSAPTQYDDSEDSALWTHSKPIPFQFDSEKERQPPDKLIAALTFNFAHFSDAEIVESFKLWLTQNRPKDWKKPKDLFPDSKRRGRKLIEYRVAVERLGLMRLLHWHTPSELQRENPAAWKKYGRKKADFRREVRESCKFFRRVFPFLPKDELPDSALRVGVWFPEMIKSVEEEVAKKSSSGA